MSTALAVSPGGAGASLPTRRASAALRILAALAVMAAAYHYSLSTLVRNLGVDSPLAYLGLVPFIALAMAASRGVGSRPEPDIHDRQLDYIVGIPLVAERWPSPTPFPRVSRRCSGCGASTCSSSHCSRPARSPWCSGCGHCGCAPP